MPDAFVQSGELPRVRRLGWPKGCSKWLGDAPFQSLRTTKDPMLGSSCCSVLSITGPCKLQSTQCSILSFTHLGWSMDPKLSGLLSSASLEPKVEISCLVKGVDWEELWLSLQNSMFALQFTHVSLTSPKLLEYRWSSFNLGRFQTVYSTPYLCYVWRYILKTSGISSISNERNESM